jgi:hypothetical protein
MASIEELLQVDGVVATGEWAKDGSLINQLQVAGNSAVTPSVTSPLRAQDRLARHKQPGFRVTSETHRRCAESRVIQPG